MVTNQEQLHIAQDSWFQEKRSAFLYRFIATREKNYNSLFTELAQEAEKQALMWEEQIKKLGGSIQSFHPDLRSRILILLIKCFGVKQLRHSLAAMKIRGMSVYLKSPPGHPMPQSVNDVGQRHRTLSSGNNIRAAVFGINDGLVSNASLIMGMVGGHASSQTVILAGLAGLLAGALSMGAGEFVSVKSQREMFEYQIDLERKELELYPEEEAEELALIYEARGMPKETAHDLAKTIMSNPDTALDTLAKEELGLDPHDLVSAYGAAFFSFISFAIGAAIPILPFLILIQKHSAIVTSISLTALTLFVVGAILSLYTGRNAIKSGLRMLLIGAGAGIITYLIGTVIGINV